MDDQKEVLLHLFANQYDPYQHLHINTVLHHHIQEHVHMQEEAKLDLHEGIPKDHIDLQQVEGALLFGHRLTIYVFQVLLHLAASQYDP